jgi:hypothetical protein
MKNYLLGLVTFLLISISGCTSLNPSFGITSFGQTATNSRDTIDGKITTETFVVVPLGMSMSGDDDMGLKIGRISMNGTLINYYFRAEVHTGNWIFAEGIAVKIDDVTYRLRDNSPNRQVQSGQYVIEILTFDITPDMLERIKNAKTFTAELHRRVVTITDEQLERVKAFIQ